MAERREKRELTPGGPSRALGPPARPLESALGFRMGRAHRSLREAWAERIADLGVSPPQAALLRAICEQPGCGLRELARWVRTDPMNAKHLADHLEAMGLVRSTSASSHRQRRDLVPTETGLALAKQLAERAAAWDRRLAKLLGAARFDQLKGLLEQLESVLAAERSRQGRLRGQAVTRKQEDGL